MEIRHFENKDVQEAGRLAYNYWSNEVTEGSERFKRAIYEYMARYYDRNRGLSFSITEGEELKGFLLAFHKSEGDEHWAWDWLEGEMATFEPEEKALALEFKRYFNFNAGRMKEYLADDDVILGLFVSTIKGGGKLLFQRISERCRQMNVPNVFLWTDTTCNYNYYYHNNFKEVTRFDTNELFEEVALKTIIFKKAVGND